MLNVANLEMEEFKVQEYGDEKVTEVDVEDEYYDEWDRLDIQEVKQLQLSKRPSR